MSNPIIDEMLFNAPIEARLTRREVRDMLGAAILASGANEFSRGQSNFLDALIDAAWTDIPIEEE